MKKTKSEILCKGQLSELKRPYVFSPSIASSLSLRLIYTAPTLTTTTTIGSHLQVLLPGLQLLAQLLVLRHGLVQLGAVEGAVRGGAGPRGGGLRGALALPTEGAMGKRSER